SLIFKDKRLKKQFINLFIPFFFLELVVVLTTLMSNLILNLWHCEESVTTGIAFAFQIFFLFNNIEVGVIFVANLFISQHYGRGDIEEVQKDYYILLRIALAVGLIFFVLVLAIPEQLLFFDNDPVSKTYAAEYLRWFSPIFLLTGPLMINYTLMKNTHLEKISTITSFSTFALLLTIESTLIFTVATAHQEWALEIAAGSMVITRFIEFIFVFIVIKKKCVVKFKIKDFFKFDIPRFKNIVYYGAPVLIGKISWSCGFLFITIFTSLNLTKSITTAHSLMINYDNIVGCMSNATAYVIAVIIGRELGANRTQKAKNHATEISKLLFYMGIIEMAFFIIFLPIVMFTTAPETLEVAGDFLWKVFLIRLIIMIPRSYNCGYVNGLFSIGGDTLYIMLSDGLTAWLTIVPLAYIGLNFNWDPLLIYALIQCEEIFKFPINVWRYKQKKWAFNVTKKKGIVFNE
ncbi:MAG: hypothetical protein MJ199_02615, partial [Bacilli bacterium]|nr:hypothetical protein [Bacilli bacterium]